MLSNQFHSKITHCVLVGVLLAFYMNTAAAVPDAATMLMNISKSVPTLMRFVTALAYLLGFYFVIKGLMMLKKFGEQRTMMSGEHHLAGPLILLFVGSLLIYLPASVQTSLHTLWSGSVNPYAWQTSSADAWSTMTKAIFLVVELIGTISFIRGLVLLTHLGGQGGQPGTFAKAMAHIIAGVLCINLYGFLQMISTTLGIGMWT
ncbi:MAG: hypothetical protein SFW66_02835 [Gammaproteobacteria bacterium]|nr:hypothetical protein [Gammaproteobacteria bacterium]